MDEQALTPSAQDYLKAVYHLGSRGRAVNTTELAEVLEVAPASVTGMLKRLSKDGYLEYAPRQGAELTSKGLQAALEVIRHHRLLESFFVRRLGMDWTQAHHEAEILEHFISEELEHLIDKAMGFPAFDPQGSPIPTREGEVVHQDWPSLVEVGTARCVVRRVRHSDRELVSYIESLGLVPGTELRVEGVGPFDGPISLTVSGRGIHLGRRVAEAVFVESLSSSMPGGDSELADLTADPTGSGNHEVAGADEVSQAQGGHA